jgi:DNA-directed RNA polymerase subunit RPC12/RpoP
MNIMEYKCLSCDYSTNINSNYNKHVKTKKHLDKLSKDVIDNKNINKSQKPAKKYTCNKCSRIFNNRQNVWKHNKICKEKEYYSQDKINELLNNFQEQITDLKNKLIGE